MRLESICTRNFVQESGQRDGTPLVFAHGFGCDQAMWRFVAPAFEATHRVIRFDYVGCGRSDSRAYDSARYGSLRGYAQDVLDIVAELDLREVIFVGHSVSSVIGILASLEAPERFSRLVLVGPSPRYIDDPPEYTGGFSASDIQSLLALMDQNYLAWAAYLAPLVMKNEDDPALASELERSFCSTDPRFARRFAEVTFLSDNRADLLRVRSPSLVLQCSDDVVAPDVVGAYCHSRLPRSAFRKLSAKGHCPHLSAPAETTVAIREYLAAPIEDAAP